MSFLRSTANDLFAQSYNHVPNATEVSFLDDVRWGGVDNGRDRW